MSNGFMYIAQRLEYQSHLVIISPWDKETKTQKHRLRSFIKFIRYYSFQVVIKKNQHSKKTEATALSRQGETTCHEEKDGRQTMGSDFLLFTGFVSTAACPVWDTFLELTLNEGRYFHLSLHRHGCCLIHVFYLIASPSQLTLFSILSRIHWFMERSFEFPSANQNSLSICR